MIGHLKGTLESKSPGGVVVDVHGVGYELLVSLQSFARLPEPGAAVDLWTVTWVREDSIELYGFVDRTERELFRLLVTVSGIGPKLALAILSGLPVPELRRALEAEDVARLQAIPGVGRKTAGRLVVELRDRVGRIPSEENGRDAHLREAVLALVNLGYRAGDAQRAVEAARRAGRERIEDLIREALRQLGR
ncbi:MAG: Holliday junction ATP-dependent DNA helicase RuvA [Candidatus Binatia bacterium]|nr:MAG: Holliday junction ATP-dependent DNA helicase RuvA [Candidatus Binatia bacterium]